MQREEEELARLREKTAQLIPLLDAEALRTLLVEVMLKLKEVELNLQMALDRD